MQHIREGSMTSSNYEVEVSSRLIFFFGGGGGSYSSKRSHVSHMTVRGGYVSHRKLYHISL